MFTGVLESKGVISKYSIDISEDELINTYTKELTLYWCEKKHPEIINKIRSNIEELIKEENED